MKENERSGSATLRSRQLDYNQKISIVFPNEKEIADIESQSSNFAPVPAKKRKKHELEDETEIGSISVKEGRGAPKDVVPIPGIRLLDPEKETAPSKRVRQSRETTSLYVHKDKEESELKTAEYDLDDEDEEFLHALANSTKLNLKSPGSKGKNNIKITEELFEALIEIFEIEFYHAQFSHQSPEKLFHFSETEDNHSCSICGGNDRDEMIYCKVCDLTVHANCYGLEEAEDSWTCQRCSEENRDEIECCYCPNKKGALKPTNEEGTWAHINCGLWIPGIEFENTDTMEPIEGPSDVDEDLWGNTCSICGLSSGISVQCDEPNCDETLHVTCGRENGYTLDFDDNSSPVKCLLYCRQHTIKHEIERKNSFNLEGLNPVQMQELDRIAKLYITNYKAHDQRRNGVQGVLLAKTYLYWRWKRKRNAGSFLRKYQQPMTEDKKLILRGGLSDREYAIRFRRLRQEFERLRMLIDQVRKREGLKRDLVRHMQSEFELETWRQKLITFGRGAFKLPLPEDPPKREKPKPVFQLSNEPKRKRGRPRKINVEEPVGVSDQEEPEEGSDREPEEEIHDEQEEEQEEEEEEEEQEQEEDESEEIVIDDEEEEDANEEDENLQSEDEIQIEGEDDELEENEEEEEQVQEDDEENEEEEEDEPEEVIDDQDEVEEEEEEESEEVEEEEEEEENEDEEVEEEEQEEEEEEEIEEVNEDESPKKNVGKSPLKRAGRSPPASPASAPSSASVVIPAPKRKGRPPLSLSKGANKNKNAKKSQGKNTVRSPGPVTRNAKKTETPPKSRGRKPKGTPKKPNGNATKVPKSPRRKAK
eukprot:TRINITY_DN2301_c0_g2_i1.p1 TRINITY_DN2301_c0_g2~~TRINITY_DN2301_c0_g2_i1.p1  ORF type:complete len:866 (-),score=359.54 TRINITY_DN2301_c0_g2_i1:199-2655(-)